MQVTETQIDDLTRQFHVVMPAADIERKVEARLGELAHTIRLPGFRPGKVPLGLMRKRYGAAVKSEVLEQAINESSQAVISERGLRAALPPKLELAETPEEGGIAYNLAVELLPEITPPDYSQISLERLTAHVDEAEIERRISRFADAVGEESEAEEGRAAADGDILVLDILSPTDDPWPFDPANLAGVRLRLGMNAPLPGFDAELQGLAAGSRKTVTVTIPEGLQRADLAGTEKTFDVEVKEVRVRTPAAIDDELAKKGGWEDLEALRTWLREQHENELKSLSRMRLKRALLDRLAEMYDFGVPNGLVEREYDSLVRQHEPAGAAAEAPPEHGHDEHVHDEHCGHEHGHDAGHEHEHEHEHEHHNHEHHDHEHAHDHEHEHAHEHAHDHHTHDGDEHAPAAAADAALSEEQRAEYRSLALRRVRLGLVLAEIGRTNNLRVQQDEMAKAMIAHARRFSGQEQMVLEFIRKNPEAQEALAAPILEEKVVDFILEMAKVEERTVDSADLLREPEEETTSAAG